MKPAISVGGRTGSAHNPSVSDEVGTSRSRGTVCDRATPRLQSWEEVSLARRPSPVAGDVDGDGDGDSAAGRRETPCLRVRTRSVATDR
jgi:hypothetical protein